MDDRSRHGCEISGRAYDSCALPVTMGGGTAERSVAEPQGNGRFDAKEFEAEQIDPLSQPS